MGTRSSVHMASVVTVADVASWLKSQFPEAKCAAEVRSNHIDGAVLRSMSEVELEQHMSIESFGLRRKIYWAIQALPAADKAPAKRESVSKKRVISAKEANALQSPGTVVTSTRAEARRLQEVIALSTTEKSLKEGTSSSLKRKATRPLPADSHHLDKLEQKQLQQGIEASKALHAAQQKSKNAPRTAKAASTKQAARPKAAAKSAKAGTKSQANSAGAVAAAKNAQTGPPVGSTVWVDWHGICPAKVAKATRWPGWYMCHFEDQEKVEKANVLLGTDSSGGTPLPWRKTRAELEALLATSVK